MQNPSVPFSSVTNDLAFSKATRFTKSILALCSTIQDTQPTNFWNSVRVPEKKQLMKKFSKKAGKCFSY